MRAANEKGVEEMHRGFRYDSYLLISGGLAHEVHQSWKIIDRQFSNVVVWESI